MLVGDSAGYLNMTRLKGIHLAMKSGMLAAETSFEILREAALTGEAPDASEARTKPYWTKVLGSWIHEEMWKVRNFRQLFQKRPFGFLRGMTWAGLHVQSAGRWPLGRLKLVADHERFRKLTTIPESGQPSPGPLPPTVTTAAKVAAERANGVASMAPKEPPVPLPAPSVKSEGIVFDKVTDVYHAGAIHDEDQPPHLVVTDLDICHGRCAQEYGTPCQYFCPAGVYEMADTDDGQGRQLRLNFSNCVHCKTCDVRDPYEIITWVTPEQGGPNYAGL